MSKTIVVCLDGTWNGPGEKDKKGNPTPSNVQKLFERLAGTPALQAAQEEFEMEYRDSATNKVQVVKYLHGVGDSENILTRYAEGSTGAGILARIVRAYTFLSRYWQEGDNIVIVGFSRGAYTARALAGLIVKQGLLDWKKMRFGDGGDPAAYAAGMTAWAEFRKAPDGRSPGFIARVDNFINLAKASILSGLSHEPQPIYQKEVGIKAIAVWDTVGALGIPQFVGEDGTPTDLFEFANGELNTKVQFGFHAIAADEERTDFTPTFWTNREGITQTLFPGAHADVGGGYPKISNQCGLSDGALRWMLQRLAEHVIFKPYEDLVPDAKGVAHQPWQDKLYAIRSQAFRQIPAGLRLSQSLIDRIDAGEVVVEGERNRSYFPEGLLGKYFDQNTRQRLANIEIDKV
ncbi:DUF2235 domain-containing protein [Undibacterium sp. Di27W]|uniref:DUF2235 domain-containing protein n=1 Tax=Undibacterium sp. Di27W TaxID=3413036 RepID=UPI003BF39B21